MTEKYDNSHTTEYTSLVATTAGGGHRKLQSEDVMIVPILLRLTEIGNKALMGVGGGGGGGGGGVMPGYPGTPTPGTHTASQ